MKLDYMDRWPGVRGPQVECLEIDLGHIHTIGAVAIQGLNQKWTKTFNLAVSKERALWEVVKLQVNSNRDITQ